MNSLKQVRQEVGLSQEKMAKAIDVSVSLYVKVEQGNTPASRVFMEKFKRAFPTRSIDSIFFRCKQR